MAHRSRGSHPDTSFKGTSHVFFPRKLLHTVDGPVGVGDCTYDTSYNVEVVIEVDLIQPVVVMQVRMLYSSCYGVFLFSPCALGLERASARGTKDQDHHTRVAHFVQPSGNISRRGSSNNRALPLRQSRRTRHHFFGLPRSCTGRRDQNRH